MGVLSREFHDVVRSFKRAAPEQGGIISGADPSAWNPNDPFPLWVIQVFIIICFTQLLAVLLSKVRQPRVIAEVIGGILLGPTVMGRIPGFTAHIFPMNSIPVLTLTSTIGLVFFLFLVGLEVDVRILRRDAKSSLSISLAGMVLPFGLGVGLAVGLYHEFVDKTKVNFSHFLLFVGVAVAITAFPVLCRILTDLDLLNDHVGVITLAAGVGNDVVGWILLALAVALTNAASGLTALWILLAGAGFVIFMLYPVRWGILWVAKRTGSLQSGTPSPIMMAITLLLILVASFFTDVIGIHPIFGGFLAGLIMPHEGGLAISLVEKLEDLVCIVFLPLYFTLSGLRTNLSLLNTGVIWGYIILICVVAFLGKFVGCALTAKLLGWNNRESTAIGTLMSCKGLVELIVLNVGFQAGILDSRVFSMFVVHALVLTVMTTPLTLWCYPPEHRSAHGTRRSKKKRSSEHQDSISVDDTFKNKFSLVLHNLEHFSAIMAITQLLQPSMRSTTTSVNDELVRSDTSHDTVDGKGLPTLTSNSPGNEPISIDALRLMELTNRTSAVMKSSEADELMHRDPLLSVFSTFGRLLNIPVKSNISIVPPDALATSVITHATNSESQMVIIPWSTGVSHNIAGEQGSSGVTPTTYNPFDGIFGKGAQSERGTSLVYANFVRRVFAESPTDVALFVDRGVGGTGKYRIFFPFFGGPDDRTALKFIVQLCTNENVSATIVRVSKSFGEQTTQFETAVNELEDQVKELPTGFPDTVYPAENTQTRLASDTADNILWSHYTNKATVEELPAHIREALWRLNFSHLTATSPLRSVIQRGSAEASSSAGASFLIVLGRSRRLATESHRIELSKIIAEQSHTSISEDIAKTVGDVATGFMAAGVSASGLLVIQAAKTSSG